MTSSRPPLARRASAVPRPPDAPALRIGHRVARTEAEGPGSRYAVWLQGCALRCAGCCNPHLFDPRGGERVTVQALARELAREVGKGGLDGLTLLGGEPFEQAAPAAALCRAARGLGLSVMVFTGHALEALQARAAGDAGVAALLAATDLLVDGPFDRARPERSRRWVGSENQRFHFLTARYAPGVERAPPGELARTVEVRIGPDGRVFVNGWPEGIDPR
ncbi:4Fe-4S cluster-binding domain-containing protein [Anaeromyxobacter paludicola]|uniref:Radical SAM protein n=1 Tax=Anaeromyxobacter paludicola TaxID=2918171 RepID=A0ABN6NBY8_9BACT|nr:4Fe-4S cluster-binding domain-containing protein [Anaeromyxobacter paludicola]BDG09448.1 radical SAM protein [Anaeromyxobacter paludicola]